MRRGSDERARVLLRRDDGAELVLAYAEWDALCVAAITCRWLPRRSLERLERDEALHLARLFAEREAEEGSPPPLLPLRRAVEFLAGGGFTAVYLGDSGG